MNKTFSLWRYLMVPACAMLMLSACSDGELVPLSDAANNTVTQTTQQGDSLCLLIEINATRTAHTRASVPTPGQDGDGREDGVNDENHVYDLTVFIYDGHQNDANLLINAPASTPILASVYATEAQLYAPGGTSTGNYNINHSRKSLPIKMSRIPVSTSTQAVVVVNMGDMTTAGITTLGELRDRIIERPWQQNDNPELCSHFTMASAGVSRISNIGGGTPDSPILLECDVERTMARIDFCWLQEPRLTTEGYDVYDVRSRVAPYTKTAEVYVRNMRLFNVMQQATYLLRRVTTGTAAAINYLGRETVSASTGIASNFVVEPRFFQKTSSARTDVTLLTQWYGDTRIGLLTNDAIIAEDGRYDYITKTKRFLNYEGQNVVGFIMAYANENTCQANETCAQFNTGVLFETIYKPLHVYCYDAASQTLTENTSYAFGQTFYRYTVASTITDEAQNIYFSDKTEAEAYMSAHADTPAAIESYPEARCYYRFWLRHANNGDNEVNGPMEFGIVRNNIYRMAVRAFYGPGSSTPDSDEHVENVKPYIFVRPWEVVVMPEVVM